MQLRIYIYTTKSYLLLHLLPIRPAFLFFFHPDYHAWLSVASSFSTPSTPHPSLLQRQPLTPSLSNRLSPIICLSLLRHHFLSDGIPPYPCPLPRIFPSQAFYPESGRLGAPPHAKTGRSSVTFVLFHHCWAELREAKTCFCRLVSVLSRSICLYFCFRRLSCSYTYKKQTEHPYICAS